MRRLCVLLAVSSVAAGVCGSAAAARPDYRMSGLQVALYRFGHYDGPIDGVVGPMTKRAIRDFQRSARLEPDGVAGKQTLAAMGRLGRPVFGARIMRRGMIGYDISVLQYLLAKRGFPPERLNSNFGPKTEELVRRFQRSVGLVPDGIVGEATRAKLVASGKRATAKAEAKAKAKAKAKATRRVQTRHVVRPGETLTSIAERHRTTVRVLAQRNALDPSEILPVGARLLVPAPGGESARASVRASLNRWAAHYGVAPRLVRALAWQESGFQSHVRSPAGGVGVMQVTDATWDYVERFLIGQRVPRTMDGNVRVGVAYLARLLREFRGDVRLAVAGYYQGPSGVRRNGLYDETRRFVANVLALRGRV